MIQGSKNNDISHNFTDAKLLQVPITQKIKDIGLSQHSFNDITD